jgi:hypothetical protein
MKTNYGKMVIGVVIGIMAALTLTLNVWGTEWYKVVTSTIAGVIIGMLISDYRVTVTIFKTGLQTAANSSWKRAQRIKNGEISKERQHEIDVSVIKGLYALLISVLAILILIAFATICISLSRDEKDVYLLVALISSVLFSRFFVLILGSLEYDNWNKRLNPQQIERIWEKKPSKHGSNSLDYDYQTDKMIGFKELTANMGLKEIINRALMSAGVVIKYNLNSDWSGIKNFFAVLAMFIFAAILFITTSLPVLPFWIINQISKHGHLLSVAAAITIGSIVGTLTHSQLIGLGSGLGFIAMGYLIERLFKEVQLFYMFRNEGLFCRLAEKMK